MNEDYQGSLSTSSFVSIALRMMTANVALPLFITEITTDGRFCVLLMIAIFASSDLYVFLPQVFAAGVPFDKDVLPYVSIMCFLFLAMVILIYQKVLFGIFIFFHFCIACTFTALIAWTMEVGVPTYQFLLLLHDLQVKNVTSIRIIFLITYLITLVLTFPAYLIYRKANGTPKQHAKKRTPPLDQASPTA